MDSGTPAPEPTCFTALSPAPETGCAQFIVNNESEHFWIFIICQAEPFTQSCTRLRQELSLCPRPGCGARDREGLAVLVRWEEPGRGTPVCLPPRLRSDLLCRCVFFLFLPYVRGPPSTTKAAFQLLCCRSCFQVRFSGLKLGVVRAEPSEAKGFGVYESLPGGSDVQPGLKTVGRRKRCRTSILALEQPHKTLWVMLHPFHRWGWKPRPTQLEGCGEGERAARMGVEAEPGLWNLEQDSFLRLPPPQLQP